jgi:hypothetical protein
MATPSSFCTVATKPCAHELFLFLNTLAIYHPNAPVHVLCDTTTRTRVAELVPKNLAVKWHCELDMYSNITRQEMEALKVWADFQMAKARAIDLALQECTDTMFMDCDIIITSPICDIDTAKQLGISPQFIQEDFRRVFGLYNGGTLWTSAKSLPDAWRKYTKTSRYYDQASIEDLATEYPYFIFGENYNFQTYRFVHPAEPIEDIQRAFGCAPGFIIYKDKPLKYLHTHITDMGQMKPINDYFIQLIKTAKMFDVYALILRTFELETQFKAI